MFPIAHSFGDVLIVPKYNSLNSRREVDISSDFKKFKLQLPIISSNMKTITGPAMCSEMFVNGGIGVLHRFNSIDNALSEYSEALAMIKNNGGNEWCLGVSIGVQEEDKERFERFYDRGAQIFVIDIAHGHCDSMRKMVEFISGFREKDQLYLIGGNVATSDAARDLHDWGVDCIKCGIGPGAACMTRRNTGVGIPQLYALEKIYEEFEHCHDRPNIIADGGIKHVGDISKALKYADACMLGSYISGTVETPGYVYKDENGDYFKQYMGSASGENKTSNGMENEYVEGISVKVKFKGHVKHLLREIKHGLQSSFTYVGACNMSEYKNKCEFINITDSAKNESKI